MNLACSALATTLKTLTAATSIMVTAPCPVTVSIANAPSGVVLDFTAAPLSRLDISGLSNVTLKGISSKNAQYMGLNITGSTNVLVVSPKFDQPGTAAINVMHSNQVEIAQPTITHAVMDGIDIAGSSNVFVHDGACQYMQPAPGAHPDCVQFWSDGGVASHDITVSGMTIYGNTQGIDNFGSNTPAAYRITVLNNTISTPQANCIALVGTVQAVVKGNRCISLPGGTVGPAQVRVYCPTPTNPYLASCPDAVVSGNVES